MSKVYGLVPARGGSKGLPNKHTRLLNGKPLLVYTLEAARDSGVFDALVVSSDSPEILDLASEWGASTLLRDAALAQDDTPTDPVIADAIAREGWQPDDRIILLQPTSPLRTAKHIVDALQWFGETPCELLTSVYPLDSKHLKAYVEEGGFLAPVWQPGTAYQRRQDLPTLYQPNGALYIFTVAAFNTDNKLPAERVAPFVMSEAESLDIDTEQDLMRCSHYLIGLAKGDAL